MDLRLLGPLEVRLEDGPIELGPRKQRAVLAMLALEVGRTVSADRLAEGLWGDEPPPSAPKMVQLYVSHLRRALAGDGRDRDPRPRLRAAAPRGRVDACASSACSTSRAPREALALWRGSRWPTSPTSRSRPPRSAAWRSCASGRPSWRSTPTSPAGRHAEVIGELEALVARIRCASACTPSGCSRSIARPPGGGARGVPRSSRGAGGPDRRRAGPELRRLHEAILAQDPALDLPVRAPAPILVRAAPPTPRAGRALLVGAAF